MLQAADVSIRIELPDTINVNDAIKLTYTADATLNRFTDLH